MPRTWRRFEVLLPRSFNDGRDVPPEWLAEAVQEVVDHYGDVSYETQTVEGHWRFQGLIYRDRLSKLVVDLPDSAGHRQWMADFKLRWQARLEQIELWMVSFTIDIE